MVTGVSLLQSTTVATAGWPLDSAMNAASSCLPGAGQGWKVLTPLMGIFLAAAGKEKNNMHQHRLSFERKEAGMPQCGCAFDRGLLGSCRTGARRATIHEWLCWLVRSVRHSDP
jgi:hypothetical protein